MSSYVSSAKPGPQNENVFGAYTRPYMGSTPFTAPQMKAISGALSLKKRRNNIDVKTRPENNANPNLNEREMIHKANSIFGFDGWSRTVLQIGLRSVDQQRDSKYSACATAVVRITLQDGTTRDGRSGAMSPWFISKGECIVSAEKLAVSEATKHALKGLGASFGSEGSRVHNLL